MPTGLPDMRGDCVVGRAVAEQSLEGRRRKREKEERHTHYLSSPSTDGIPQDLERCKEGGVVAAVVAAAVEGGELQDERFEA